MKRKLLLLTLCAATIAAARPNTKITTNPAIGIMMSAVNNGSNVFFNLSIKNTGDEPLINIYVTPTATTSDMEFNSFPVASLAPGEEIFLSAYKTVFGTCDDLSQVIVHATPISSTIEITDLSSDPYYFDNNGLPGSYYNDFATFSWFYNSIGGSQEGIYEDTNNNSIIDVGDVIHYTYTVYGGMNSIGDIFDSNAIIVNPHFDDLNTTITGIHYITPEDVALGYVYNTSYIIPWTPCTQGLNFSDASPCSCPNPNGANIVTPLTSDLPNQISGKVKFNSNNDNCASGLNFANRRVNASNGGYTYSSYTDVSGDYHILIPNTGTYNTSALTNLNANFTSTPSFVDVASSGSGVAYDNTDFCIGSASNYTDLSVNMFNINEAIPGNAATYRITYTNYGSTSLNGSIQLTFNGGKLTLTSASPVQSAATASTLTWNYSNLLPFEKRIINLSLNVLIPPTVNINDLLNFVVLANPIGGDSNTINNTFSWNQTVRSSFDPNDKTVIEGPSITPLQTGNYLNYVTRFQNSGTANATTVVIKETLDPKLDWDSFEPIASSHGTNVQIKNGNQLTYTFSNIDLPYESANAVGSHGWMAYRIKPKSDVVSGDIMTSKSDIYFDYNPPIMTNAVSTQVSVLAAADFNTNDFKLYPNPASGYFIIESNLTGNLQYEIADVNGKLLQEDTTESQKPIDINILQRGFYFVTVKTANEKATYKLIKN